MIPGLVSAAMALALSPSALAQATAAMSSPISTLPPTTSTPNTSASTFELEVIFPRANTTYDYTHYIPLVFAFQNPISALSIGNFRFQWCIMPYGGDDEWVPGGICEEPGTWINSSDLSGFEKSNKLPYIFTNATNITNWQSQGRMDTYNHYALQWYVQWDLFQDNSSCRQMYSVGDMTGSLFFTLYGGWDDARNITDDYYPRPEDLGGVAENCAQFAGLRQMDGSISDLCAKAKEVSGGNPCAVRPDASMVSSISSVASLQAKPTPTASETATTTSPSKNAARPTVVPARYAFVIAGVVGGLSLPI